MRYFAVSELASRCVSVTYERRADGKIYVNNEMTNRLWVQFEKKKQFQ